MSSPTITTFSNMSTFFPQYYDRLLGDNLRPNLYFYDLGEKRKLPANFGTSIKIPRLKKQNIVYTPGTEGAVTNSCPLSAQFVSGTLVKFRGSYKHSDLVIMTALSDVVQLSLEDISYSLALQMDTHIRAKLCGQFQALNGNTLSTGSTVSSGLKSTHYFKPRALVKAEIILENSDNPRYPGTNKYAMVINPRLKWDIVGSTSSTYPGWIDVVKYQASQRIWNGEIGEFFGFKVISTTNGKFAVATMSVANTSTSVAMCLAPRAYYVTELSEMSARTFVKQLGSAGAADPTNDYATVGAKCFFTAIPATYAATEYRAVRLFSTTSASF